MKTKLATIAVAALFIAAWPLSAEEAVSEVLIITQLAPAAQYALPSLPEARPVELLFEDAVPLGAPQLAVPRTIPILPASARSGKAWFEANLALMVGLSAADYFTTREALKYPGLEEANPLMRPFVKSPAAFAAIKIGTTALTYWSMKAIFKKNKTFAWVLTTATNVVLGYVVANNIRLIEGARAR